MCRCTMENPYLCPGGLGIAKCKCPCGCHDVWNSGETWKVRVDSRLERLETAGPSEMERRVNDAICEKLDEIPKVAARVTDHDARLSAHLAEAEAGRVEVNARLSTIATLKDVVEKLAQAGIDNETQIVANAAQLADHAGRLSDHHGKLKDHAQNIAWLLEQAELVQKQVKKLIDLIEAIKENQDTFSERGRDHEARLAKLEERLGYDLTETTAERGQWCERAKKAEEQVAELGGELDIAENSIMNLKKRIGEMEAGCHFDRMDRFEARTGGRSEDELIALADRTEKAEARVKELQREAVILKRLPALTCVRCAGPLAWEQDCDPDDCPGVMPCGTCDAQATRELNEKAPAAARLSGLRKDAEVWWGKHGEVCGVKATLELKKAEGEVARLTRIIRRIRNDPPLSRSR